MYIVSKKTNRNEYRVYVNGSDIDGSVIYKGHKLGVELDILKEIIDYKIERSSNNIHFLMYEYVEDDVSHLNSRIWNKLKSESFSEGFTLSWESLLSKMVNDFGSFNKILITKFNI